MLSDNIAIEKDKEVNQIIEPPDELDGAKVI